MLYIEIELLIKKNRGTNLRSKTSLLKKILKAME